MEKIVVADIVSLLNEVIPFAYQEDYDNSGLQAGDPSAGVDSVILSVDVTEEVVEEAINTGAGMIISHHPVIFREIKSITGKNMSERALISALKNDIAICSVHTNLDQAVGGVSYRMAEKIGLKNVSPLIPLTGKLTKIVVFVPSDHAEKVRDAMFSAGAGSIGNYDRCSYYSSGTGTFRAGDNTSPWVGKRGDDHHEPEVRVETITPRHLTGRVVSAMKSVHPYDEVAFDIYNLENEIPDAGMGVVGELSDPLSAMEFTGLLKKVFDLEALRYSDFRGSEIVRVAMCGGAGGSLAGKARTAGADAFVTADVRYHSFFDGEGKMMIADIGHYESEKCSLEILYEIITKKFPKFAVRFSTINTNPVNYLPAWKK
ncbi:MAG: Nif3-like dinuclear metal center hexameric protein [Bacteroidales bacterium]|nr:Nif3-like dinuclear metal center hexameric protein [Bacteroidales bacterium]